jgi:Polyketide cyclase / dehydrase and lipid transport
MLMSTLIILGAVAIAFLVYVAIQPNDFRVERTRQIQATPEAIRPLIDDLSGFNRWNPFAKSDPGVKIVYSGPAQGIGAAYDWSGKKSGAGRMEVIKSDPTKIVMKLDFNKPFRANNQAEFTLRPQGAATAVTWAMTGTRSFLHKLMGTLFNMDRMVGGEFAKGLADLETIATNRSQDQPS